MKMDIFNVDSTEARSIILTQNLSVSLTAQDQDSMSITLRDISLNSGTAGIVPKQGKQSTTNNSTNSTQTNLLTGVIFGTMIKNMIDPIENIRISRTFIAGNLDFISPILVVKMIDGLKECLQDPQLQIEEAQVLCLDMEVAILRRTVGRLTKKLKEKDLHSLIWGLRSSLARLDSICIGIASDFSLSATTETAKEDFIFYVFHSNKRSLTSRRKKLEQMNIL